MVRCNPCQTMPIPRFAGLSLLVADDSAPMRRLVREMVLRVGIGRVLEAPDGAQAMGLLAEARPDLVVVDWDLPLLSGEDFVRLARTVRTSPAPRVPILVTMAQPRRSAVGQAVGVGAHAVLAKPFSPAALWERLEEAVHRPRPFLECGELLRPRPRAGAVAA